MSSAVVKKIETILHSSYDIKNYVDLVREIFPDVRIVAPEKLTKNTPTSLLTLRGLLMSEHSKRQTKRKSSSWRSS